MSQYNDVLREINETLSNLEEAKREISATKFLIDQTKIGLDTANGPGLGAFRQDLLDELSDLKDELDWWYDEKESCYDRLRELNSEKAKIENPQWQQKCCNSQGCNKLFWYRVDWEHIPNYCPDCKRRFNSGH